MASLFTRIIKGEIPCHKVAEDDKHIAFLDIQPVAMGHVLVVPKEEVDYIFDLSPEGYSALWSFASEVAKALKLAVPCRKVGVTVIGLEVPHTHVHLVPMQSMDDMNFSRPKLQPGQDELAEVARKISAQFELLSGK
jgi:histidine triad (HIT) family protein